MVRIVEQLLFVAMIALSLTWADPDPNFHIYFAYGQSNMEGAALPYYSDQMLHPRFKIFASHVCERLGRDEVGQIYSAEPCIFNCGYGVSMANWFALNMVDSLPDVTIGIIPVAVGGSSIKIFDKDQYADYFAHADTILRKTVLNYASDGNLPQLMIDLGKKAQEVGVIKGVIFHQGETDVSYPEWLQTVKKTRDDLFEALGLSADTVPFVAGEFLRGGCCYPGRASQLAEVMDNAYVVSSEGLSGKDQYHFTHDSYVELGKRYAEKMLEAQRPKPEEPTKIHVSRSRSSDPRLFGKNRVYDLIGRLVLQ